MNELSAQLEREEAELQARWSWLPARLRPRSREAPGRGELRRVENTLLVLALLLLTVATVYDVARQVRINHRLTADIRTWRLLTGHDYHNVSLQQDLRSFTTTEVVCGNTSPGPPGSKPQICLIVTGPIRGGLRSAKGGFYLPPYVQNIRADRYGCFGTAARASMCGLATPAGAPHGSVLEGG
jgi:hypothetical protein